MQRMAEPVPALPEQPLTDKKIDGKWVVLVCYIGSVRDKVVYVIEWEDRPWKKHGQESIPFETIEPGENAEQAVKRAIREELDLPESALDFMEDKWNLFLVVNRDSPDRIVLEAKVFLVQLRAGTQIKNIVDGVELLERWLRSPNAFNGNARPGTKLALKIAIWSRDSANPIPFVTIEEGEETGEY